MILKEADQRAGDLQQLETLLREAPDDRRRERIEREIRNIRSGLRGEGSAAHFLNREFRDSRKIGLIHDLRLHAGDEDYAQIDHVMIHRVQGTAWILETKNYSGRITCDAHGDWTVWYGKNAKPIPSPVNQAKRQCITFQKWLEQRGIKGISRFVPVVLISPTSSVDRRKLPKDANIIKSDNFAGWWEKETAQLGMGQMTGMLGRYLLNGMDGDNLELLGRKLRDAHTPAQFDWRARMNMPEADPEPAPAPFLSAEPQGGILGRLARRAPAILDRLSRDAPAAVAQTIGSLGQKTPPIAGAVGRETIARDEVQTPHGVVRLQTLPDGRIALRHGRVAELSEAVAQACRGRAQWNPRYGNWIVNAQDIEAVLQSIS